MTYAKTTKKVYENGIQTDIGLCKTALAGCEVHFRESKDGEYIYAEVVGHCWNPRYLRFINGELVIVLKGHDFYDWEVDACERAHILFHIIDGLYWNDCRCSTITKRYYA